MLYSVLRPLLFKLDAETAHTFTFSLLEKTCQLGGAYLIKQPQIQAPVNVMGLTFPNPIGLAAGLDKNGAYVDALAQLGFGFIEVGTVTPKPQDGNPKPRMFRLPEYEAIINRMGFNNQGVDTLVNNLTQCRFKGIVGVNIGKNATTPIEKAIDDYLICFKKVYAYASYVAVNISSPNTKNLRQLQQSDELAALLTALKDCQQQQADRSGRYVPLALKIAPDLTDSEIAQIAQHLIHYKIDAVIATNTTLTRPLVNELTLSQEAGGLSGKPVGSLSTHVIQQLAHHLEGRLPIIGVGGILSASDAQEKIAAGASLVQLYTGLIYQGPKLVTECARRLASRKI